MEETKKEEHKVLGFVKKHKTKFIMGGIGLLGLVIALADTKRRSNSIGAGVMDYEALRMEHHPDVIAKATKAIDEEIFTDLAIKLEEVVINDKIDTYFEDRYFDLGHDGLFKHVEIKVNQYAGD